MPVTRASRNQLPAPPSPRQGKSNLEIISLDSSSSSSSSTTESTTFASLGSPSKRKEKSKPMRPKPKPVLRDVIEISSGEESPLRPPIAPVQKSSLTELRKEVKRLKAENAKDNERARAELETLTEEIKQLKGAQEHTQEGKFLLDNSEVEDIISCGICSHVMFSPFMLPGCGHTFCLTCLQDWLNTTLARFVNDNPQYDVNQPAVISPQILHILQNQQLMNYPHVPALLQHYLQQQPQYTCPGCREPIQSKPVEDFVLRSLVRAIGVANKQNVPRTPPRGKGPNAGPLDGFFPRR